DSGVISFAGEEIRSLPVLELRRRMGYAIQSIGLFPHWSVAQNIATVPQLQKWSRARIDDRIDELMSEPPARKTGHKRVKLKSFMDYIDICLAENVRNDE
ncbi:hypothetical protein NE471_27575, partial [Escherichia coli]|nr:hypothetical protein [Escherichia coli]